jgi:hypothetical protein
MEPFALERWQSHYENRVRYNLSESGVHPLTLRELLELAGESDALTTSLGYGQTNGTERLRERIAALYEGVDAGLRRRGPSDSAAGGARLAAGSC